MTELPTTPAASIAAELTAAAARLRADPDAPAYAPALATLLEIEAEVQADFRRAMPDATAADMAAWSVCAVAVARAVLGAAR